MTPEDPLVLEWLKKLQDVSSPGRQILPTRENNESQTFNNVLVASAFILKGERERAERILDFFAKATDRTTPTRSCRTSSSTARREGSSRRYAEPARTAPRGHDHRPGPSDRWMGDMVWLMFAYKHYEQLYGPDRYRELTRLVQDLLVSWYTDSADVPGGGYVQHGWRKGDKKLHEDPATRGEHRRLRASRCSATRTGAEDPDMA